MEVDVDEGNGAEDFIVVKPDNEKSDEETIAEIEESLTDWIACRQDTIKKLREIAAYIGKVQCNGILNEKCTLLFVYGESRSRLVLTSFLKRKQSVGNFLEK